jgi:glucans biosynthesis protein
MSLTTPYRWALLFAGTLAYASIALAFDFPDVVDRARDRAAQAYVPPTEAPQFMREIGYDQYRGMRHQPRNNLWRGTDARFEVSPVMPGGVYRHVIPINEVDGSTVRRLPFRKEHFKFDEPELAGRIPDDLGYAGFELSYPFGRRDEENKFLVFAGASYFRGVGQGQQWGLSVRGAAIDTGRTTGEEFPDFVEFWLVRPRPWSTHMTVYALLDSPRLTGAYEFVISPGKVTQLAVRTVLFTRARIEQLGIAPLTSMYFYGENTPRPPDAWRPEVHDSDGLLVEERPGKWTWQPLIDPAAITIDALPGRTFALMQRDTDFRSYEDAEANYHRRPSALVTPQRGFDNGRILLVQLPTRNEFLDNIVAFWSPLSGVDAGSRLEMDYRLAFGGPDIVRSKVAQVVRTFVGRDVIDATSRAGQYRFIVDFRGGNLDAPHPAGSLTARVDSDEGTEVLEHQLKRVDASGAWRLSILARAPADIPLGLRASLFVNGTQATETWRYQLDAHNALRSGH